MAVEDVALLEAETGGADEVAEHLLIGFVACTGGCSKALGLLYLLVLCSCLVGGELRRCVCQLKLSLF